MKIFGLKLISISLIQINSKSWRLFILYLLQMDEGKNDPNIYTTFKNKIGKNSKKIYS